MDLKQAISELSQQVLIVEEHNYTIERINDILLDPNGGIDALKGESIGKEQNESGLLVELSNLITRLDSANKRQYYLLDQQQDKLGINQNTGKDHSSECMVKG